MLLLNYHPLFPQARPPELFHRLSLRSRLLRICGNQSIHLALLLHRLHPRITSDSLLTCHAQHLPLPLLQVYFLLNRLSRLAWKKTMIPTIIQHLLEDMVTPPERPRLKKRASSPNRHLLLLR